MDEEKDKTVGEGPVSAEVERERMAAAALESRARKKQAKQNKWAGRNSRKARRGGGGGEGGKGGGRKLERRELEK